MDLNQSKKKRKLWAEHLEIKRYTDITWIFLGNLNLVRYKHERFNSKFCRTTTTDFNNFIVDTSLQGFNLRCKKFTYLCDDGIKIVNWTSIWNVRISLLNSLSLQSLSCVVNILITLHCFLSLQIKIFCLPISLLQIMDTHG